MQEYDGIKIYVDSSRSTIFNGYSLDNFQRDKPKAATNNDTLILSPREYISLSENIEIKS